MNLGSITFGPNLSAKEAEERASIRGFQWAQQYNSQPIEHVQACNCMGPQSGETKCPCSLRSEMAQAHRMLSDGVVIAGRKYRLVPVEGT